MTTVLEDNKRATLIADLHSAADGWIKAINLFTQEQFNVKPAEGVWSAAQVTEHIIKAVGGTVHVVNGPVKDSERPYDAHGAMLRDMFLDFTTQMQSPEALVPSDEQHDKEKQLAISKDIFDKLYKSAETQDLTQFCTAFEFPTVGSLSRYEWLSFTTYHTQRHTNQLEKLAKQLK